MKFWRNSDFRIFNEFCDYFWSFFLLTKFFKNFKNSMKFELNSWRILAHNFWQISSLFKVQEFLQNSWKIFYELCVFSEFWHNYSRIRDEFLTNFQKTNLRSLQSWRALRCNQRGLLRSFLRVIERIFLKILRLDFQNSMNFGQTRRNFCVGLASKTSESTKSLLCRPQIFSGVARRYMGVR